MESDKIIVSLSEVNNIQTDWFSSSFGVKQGDFFLLFSLQFMFMVCLFREIKESDLGSHLERDVTRTKSTEHVTPLLIQLHWLPVSQRINLKILLLNFKAFHTVIYHPFTSKVFYTLTLAPYGLHQQSY